MSFLKITTTKVLITFALHDIPWYNTNMSEPFVFKVNNPPETPQSIAGKLNSLVEAVDVKAIMGGVSRNELADRLQSLEIGLKDSIDEVSKKNFNHIEATYVRESGRKKMEDQRWHGGGSTLRKVATALSQTIPAINTDAVDTFILTAQTTDITSFTTNLSGTPKNAQTLWIAITGTAARVITWGAKFEASTVNLPSTTVSTDRLDIGFVWNAATNKWRCIASV